MVIDKIGSLNREQCGGILILLSGRFTIERCNYTARKPGDVQYLCVCGDTESFIWQPNDPQLHTDSVVKLNELCITLFPCLPLFHLSD